MKKILLITLFFVLGGISLFAQEVFQPKNLKQAVEFLDKNSPQALKDTMILIDNKELMYLFYPLAKINIDGSFVDNWVKGDSKIKKHLQNKGLKYNEKQAILESFKYFLIHGTLDEKIVLQPLKENTIRLLYEDKMLSTIDTLRGVYIPKDIDDCFKELNLMLSDSTRLMIMGWSEDEASSNLHFGLGMWLRNNWGLWRGSRLSKYFNDMGIYHGDDMSGIILDSYHRYLYNNDIKLEDQVKDYQDYWKKDKKDEEERKENAEKRAVEEFNQIKIGDTLTYQYSFGFVSEAQEDKYLDDECLAIGVVIGKNYKNKFLHIKIIESCDKKGIVIYDDGDMLEYDKKLKQWVDVKKPKIKKAKKGAL